MFSPRILSKNSSMPLQGFALLEVLVTLLIVSLGLLGIAALQLSSVRYSHGGYLRSVAVIQAQSMVDRMRANPNGVTEGYYDNLSGIASGTACASACSPSQAATRDHIEWSTENQALLPSGQGSVVANGNTFTVTVYWDEQRTGATGLSCSNNPAVDLSCYRVTCEL